MKERALILFTLLTQAAIGAFIIFYLIHPWIAQIAGKAATHVMTRSFLLAIGALFGLGLLVSLFHLGTPLLAYRALANLRSSWLSREILFALIFACLWASVALLEWRQDGASFIQNLLTWLKRQQFGHPGHHIGLRDGLSIANWQGMIFISL